MPRYRVCIALTCYTDYEVEAPSEEKASELTGARPRDWKEEDGYAEAGYSDDPLVVVVEELK